jgi:hypothetical protein
MKYVVDLEKKEIVYDPELPTGHIAALKKIYKDKGYEMKMIDHIPDLTFNGERIPAPEIKSFGGATTAYYPTSNLASDSNFDMNLSNSGHRIVDRISSAIATGQLPFEDAIKITEDNGLEITHYIYQRYKNAANDYRHSLRRKPFTPDECYLDAPDEKINGTQDSQTSKKTGIWWKF